MSRDYDKGHNIDGCGDGRWIGDTETVTGGHCRYRIGYLYLISPPFFAQLDGGDAQQARQIPTPLRVSSVENGTMTIRVIK